MTILEIILIIIIAYLIIAHIMNYISIAFGCYLMEYEDLTANLLWVIFLPAALFRRFFLNK